MYIINQHSCASLDKHYNLDILDPCGKLLFHLKFAVYVINKMLPGSMIAYSHILLRRIWRYSNNTNVMSKYQLQQHVQHLYHHHYQCT
jgi:hypothetical protein